MITEGADEVLAAEFDGIHFQLARGFFDDALHHEGRFRAAGAAIGIDRRGVRIDRVDLAVDGGDVVLAGEKRAVEIRRH